VEQHCQEIERRFSLQEEYQGTTNPVHSVEPLVSVTVATYQHAPYIRECLDSLLAQRTTFPYEILIGEDASTDGTREICMEYAVRHPDRIRFFPRDRKLSHLPVGNRTMRLNGRWLRKSARGAYLAPCEGDDYWCDPHKLQLQVEMFQQNPELALVHGDAHQFFQASGQWRRHIHQAKGDLKEGGNLFEALITSDYRVVTCTAMYRRDWWDQIAGLESYQKSWQQFPMGDTPLWLELSRFGSFGYLDRPLGVYRTLEESASQSRDPRRKLNFQLAMLWMRLHYMDCYEVSSEFRRQVIERRARNLLAKASTLGHAEAVEQLWKLLQRAEISPRIQDHFYRHGSRFAWGSRCAGLVHRLSERLAVRDSAPGDGI
jgi:glycosyltransferase involved in cell wall biosynthesis